MAIKEVLMIKLRWTVDGNFFGCMCSLCVCVCVRVCESVCMCGVRDKNGEFYIDFTPVFPKGLGT